MTGRFFLAVLPGVLLVSARLIPRLFVSRIVRYGILVGLALHLYTTGHLIRLGFAGDNRAEAASWILQNTSRDDTIIGTLDAQLLGLTPTPEVLDSTGAHGSTNTLIVRERIVGDRSRHYWYSTPRDLVRHHQLGQARYAVLSLDGVDDYTSSYAVFVEAGYTPRATFGVPIGSVTTPENDHFHFLPWDMTTPVRYLPIALYIHKLEALGPAIVILEKT